MCGIVGVIDPSASRAQIQPIVRRMAGAIVHRGPDDDGFFGADGVGLGMRRLSIIDLAGGQQPIYNEDGRLALVFNGEIYNYRELRAQLQGQGHRFRTESDTEVIVHLYEEHGDACVHHLRGMFAFALWDKSRRRLLVARDRLGIKPLYYVQAGERLIFGSEIKALLQHPAVDARLDLEGLSGYLSLKYVPAPHTLFAGVRSLPPGHALTWSAGGPTVRRYWDLSFAQQRNGHHSEAEYAEELATLLRDSVRLRLRSDVPFGAFLSGGVDSSTIVAYMSELLDEPVKTFTVGFAAQGGTQSELPYARLIAEQYRTDHHEIFVSARDFVDKAEKVIWHLDQPIADQATVATLMVAELAAEHVKMVLTGEGGDELFAGYARYSGERLSPIFRALPGALKPLLLNASRHLPGLRGRRPQIALHALAQASEAARLTNWFPLFNSEAKQRLLAPALAHELRCAASEDAAAAVVAQTLAQTDARAPLNRMLYADSKLWLPDYLLLRGDKLTMAASLEARVPLLDHKLVEFAATLPPHLKLNGLTRKYLLKRVSGQVIPEAIIQRKKEGFPIPIGHWLRTEARDFLHDLLSPTTLRRRGLFDADFVAKLLQENESGAANHSLLLWGLASVELWQQIFLDRQPQVSSPVP